MSTSSFDRDSKLAEAYALTKSDFSKPDEAKFHDLIALADATGPEGRRLKRAKMAAAELELGIRNDENSGASEVEADFQAYLLRGREAVAPERRAQSITADGAGGFLVPASFRNQLEVALKAYDGLFDVAGVWQSATGSACTVPILADISQSAQVIAENSTISEVDVPFDGIAFGKTPSWKSGIVVASMELSQDSYFNLSDKLATAFAVRFARGIGASLVTTLKSQADVGVTAASTTVIAPSELLDCMAALDSAYWANSSWCMNKSTLISLLKLGMLTDAAGQAITMWTTGPLRLFDKPIAICPSYDSATASQLPISFGDHSKFLRREVANSLRVKELSERFAPYGKLGWTALWRVDGALLKPSAQGSPAVSASPVQFLQMHA
jgi:HK97 family phage major capsid protein